MGRAYGVLPDDLRETRKTFGAGDLEDRLQHGGRHQGAQPIAPENDNRALDGLDRLQGTVVSAVGHLQQTTHERRVARDERGQFAAGHFLVVDGTHQLREQVRAPWRIATLFGCVADSRNGHRQDTLVVLSWLRPVRDPELELPQSAEDLGAVEYLHRSRRQYRRLRKGRHVREQLR